MAINSGGVWAIYRSELARTRAHDLAERRGAGDHHGAVFHRLRRRDRIAHAAGRRRRLRRVHRAGADHALAADAEHLERVDRHLLPEIHRDDFRNPVGAAVLRRGRRRLCRRGRHQVGCDRPHHPGDRNAVRAGAHSPSRLDGRLPPADLGRVQPVRLHHRHLGQDFRAARDHTGADRHAAHLPRRGLLFDRHAAPVLAHRQPFQSGRLSGERLPLELLWPRRRERRRQPRLHGPVHRHLPGGPVADLPAPAIASSRDGASAKSRSSAGTGRDRCRERPPTRSPSRSRSA